MSQTLPATLSEAASGPGSEKDAMSPTSTRTTSSAPLSAASSRVRSCVVCRSRKVRCDKQTPCSNCRRANIACVFADTNRPPRWARRVERLSKNAASATPSALQAPDSNIDRAMDRLRNLENLVKELSSQLQQARSVGNHSSGGNSPGWSTHDHDLEGQAKKSADTENSPVQKQFGRLVLQDANHSRYVSSGFWSRVNDELNGLKMDTRELADENSDSSENESWSRKSSTYEIERTPSERHAFLFRHNLGPPAHDTHELHPLPSQIPYLLDVFAENVNFTMQIVHMPTVTKMVRELRGDMTLLTPTNEALIFSIYYAAITSMEEDDIMINFGSSKHELNLKYRIGLEYALAKANFLEAPELGLVQALANFVCLVRRHDSPRYAWMMTGLMIRMAQYLGLQRDGSHFDYLTPYEIEMRRRIWWALCNLDMRASEDQGTDLTIVSGTFDTKIPLNINDADLSPESKKMPVERDGITDVTFARVCAGSCIIMRQMMAISVKDGAAGLEDQSRLINEIYQKYENDYLRYTTPTGNIGYWVAVTIARLVMAKMTLIVFLPVLFSSPSDHFSDEIRTKLLVSAIEVAEYNHALNAEQACRHHRWIFQTYTHWHAIVYLMIEISRRPWSPIVERAWMALHSSWLIPSRTTSNKRMWVPLRKLMAKARQHRDAEIERLQTDPQEAARLEAEDRNMSSPPGSGQGPDGSSGEMFRERWRKLVKIPEEQKDDNQAVTSAAAEPPLFHTPYEPQSVQTSAPVYVTNSPTQYIALSPQGLSEQPTIANNTVQQPTTALEYSSASTIPTEFTDGRTLGPGFLPWLWPETDLSTNVFSNFEMESNDVNMDFDDTGVNWYDWVESAKGMECDGGTS